MESLLIQFPEPMVQKMNEIVARKHFSSRAEYIRDCVRKSIGENKK
jgi:metal-responsive CopG/Arc/MetJ family transcriptional regulator